MVGVSINWPACKAQRPRDSGAVAFASVNLIYRTVIAIFIPGAIVRVAGTNAAWVLPLPVIFTSTTGPAGWAAAGCAAGVWVCVWSAFFSPPQAMAPRASRTPKAVNRIAALLREMFAG